MVYFHSYWHLWEASKNFKVLTLLTGKYTATLGAFSLGNVVAWSSSALPQIEEEIVLDGGRNWIVSVYMIGAALVPWFAGNLQSPNSSQYSHSSRIIQHCRQEVVPRAPLTSIHYRLAPPVLRPLLGLLHYREVPHGVRRRGLRAGGSSLHCRDSGDQVPRCPGYSHVPYVRPWHSLHKPQLQHRLQRYSPLQCSLT